MKQRNRQAGFTLMELIIVIVIIAIGAALTTPMLASYNRSANLRADAQKLLSLLQEAKMLAIKQQQNVRIFFDTTATPQKVDLFSGQGPNGTWDNGGDDILATSYNLAQGNSFGHGNATAAIGASFDADNVTFAGNSVTFNTRGLTGNSGYAYVQNTDGTTYAIGALTTGFLMLRRWTGSTWE
ncbi:pilus assembly FimT family protein [Desulfuromonas thiophila]|uniref:Type II secretion system protein H n=1 Tax=Desulfuromonas thiophila TaxID=57664 RepID=A0A1G7E264_9BACT|nr:GspH/FimT family pseudopilin [Desulfuromonas thiophila]SDE57774.1 Type II transport protein GspH [Desulfuromonas thiophila]